MHRIDGPTRAAALPTPSAAGTGGSSPGYFASGDPLTQTPPTTVTVDWANAVQEEIAHVIEQAGVALDKSSHIQLMAALSTLFVAQGGVGGSGVVVGTTQASIPLAGGFILKVGSTLGSYSEGAFSDTFSAAFPTKCWAVIAIAINSAASTIKDTWVQRISKSVTGFTIMCEWSGVSGTTNQIDGIDWIALGN